MTKQLVTSGIFQRGLLWVNDVHLVLCVFTVAVDEVFAVECVVGFKRAVRLKPVSIDGQRLLLVVAKQESNRRFIQRFVERGKIEADCTLARLAENDNCGFSLDKDDCEPFERCWRGLGRENGTDTIRHGDRHGHEQRRGRQDRRRLPAVGPRHRVKRAR